MLFKNYFIKFDKTVKCQQYMKNIPQRILEYNIGLVKYENPGLKDCFDLTTIHSLLIDQNPKFIDLRQLIVEYNSNQVQKKVNRQNLQRPFIQRLYQMLSQLTRIPKSQNQLIYLNKIHAWAFHEDENDNNNIDNANDGKNRPGTASTKTRPYSAYTKKTRPDSAFPSKQQLPTKKIFQTERISKAVIEKHSNVDFKQLKNGQQQFFTGHRTLHPELQKPKVRLKQYDRKVLFEDPDQDQKFKQFLEEKKKPFKKKQKLPELPLEEEILLAEEPKQELPNAEGNLNGDNPQGQIVEGQQGAQDALQIGQQEGNLEENAGGQEGGQQGVAEQQQVEVIDKLRPRLKVYGDQLMGISRDNQQNYQKGVKIQIEQQNKLIRGVEQDKIMTDMMQDWAATKNRVKIQQRRRAQSARMVNRRVGIPFQKYKQQKERIDKKQEFNGVQVVDLSNVNPSQLKSTTRPLTAFTSKSTRVYNQSIKDAMITGKLDNHLFSEPDSNQINPDLLQRLGTFAAKPKKKTFQQILRDAEQRVNQQTNQQIQKIKQKLTNNRITIGGNKIFRSLSHQQPQILDGEFVGQIVGQGMIKNPFFKVAKKKKKKKKKK